MCVFFSTEKWSIKYGSYCIVYTAQMKFASEARPSQYIGPRAREIVSFAGSGPIFES